MITAPLHVLVYRYVCMSKIFLITRIKKWLSQNQKKKKTPTYLKNGRWLFAVLCTIYIHGMYFIYACVNVPKQ